MTPKGLLVAAPRSGAGKTTVTLALIAALRRRGVSLRTAKSGPDYIDPAFHAAASGHPGTNLDTWAMPPGLLQHLARGPGGGPDLLLVESAMGLFDGIPAPPGRSGAAADLAETLGLPVVLVLDVSGQSQTAAAVAHGMNTFRPSVSIAGVILNRVGSPRHRAGIEAALALLHIPVLGAIPRDPALTLPERHLGLVQAQEHPALQAHLDVLADMAERCLDLDAILSVARALDLSQAAGASFPAASLCPPGQRIALAQDAAFSFIYPHLVTAWRGAGAEILPFSPLANQPPPLEADCCWLPGGYPELHAGSLAAASGFLAGLRSFAQTRPIHGECGGYMVLGTVLEDAAGISHRMAALLDHRTSFARRRMTLGYRRAIVQADGILGRCGTTLRGHEFHYSTCVPGVDEPLASLQDGAGIVLPSAGSRRDMVTGSFFHVIAAE